MSNVKQKNIEVNIYNVCMLKKVLYISKKILLVKQENFFENQ